MSSKSGNLNEEHREVLCTVPTTFPVRNSYPQSRRIGQRRGVSVHEISSGLDLY